MLLINNGATRLTTSSHSLDTSLSQTMPHPLAHQRDIPSQLTRRNQLPRRLTLVQVHRRRRHLRRLLLAVAVRPVAMARLRAVLLHHHRPAAALTRPHTPQHPLRTQTPPPTSTNNSKHNPIENQCSSSSPPPLPHPPQSPQ